MSSVTNRIKEIKQPKGGYINLKEFKEIELNDEKNLNDEENIHAGLIGMVVDYLSRLNMGSTKKEAFKISLMGAMSLQETDKANKLLDKIKGLDDESIISACKLVGYDVCFRAGKSFFKPVEEINPDKKTIENIRVMVERINAFIKEYGPVIDEGMTFTGGYTQTITAGDADFMTEDTLWDFKVSNDKPKSAHTLQLLVYYLLGIHSDKEKYSKLKNLGIYNPRLNKVFIIEIDKISRECIKAVEDEVIGYDENNSNRLNNNNNNNNNNEFFTVTDLTRILKCSRFKVMQLYSNEGLPLRKYKNKYVIGKIELLEWIAQKEKEEAERRKQMLIVGCVSMVVLLIMVIGLFVFLTV